MNRPFDPGPDAPGARADHAQGEYPLENSLGPDEPSLFTQKILQTNGCAALAACVEPVHTSPCTGTTPEVGPEEPTAPPLQTGYRFKVKHTFIDGLVEDVERSPAPRAASAPPGVCEPQAAAALAQPADPEDDLPKTTPAGLAVPGVGVCVGPAVPATHREVTKVKHPLVDGVGEEGAGTPTPQAAFRASSAPPCLAAEVRTAGPDAPAKLEQLAQQQPLHDPQENSKVNPGPTELGSCSALGGLTITGPAEPEVHEASHSGKGSTPHRGHFGLAPEDAEVLENTSTVGPDAPNACQPPPCSEAAPHGSARAGEPRQDLPAEQQAGRCHDEEDIKTSLRRVEALQQQALLDLEADRDVDPRIMELLDAKTAVIVSSATQAADITRAQFQEALNRLATFHKVVKQKKDP